MAFKIFAAAVTLIVSVACVALLPKLSLALTVSVSWAAEESVSVSVLRSAFTWISVPAMVSVLLALDGVMVPPPPMAPVVAQNPAASETTR